MAERKAAKKSGSFNDPVEAIKFYMNKHGLSRRDLEPMIGSRSKVSEVLSGARPLTMPMARALHKHLGIPAEALLKEPVIYTDAPGTEIDWRKFPLKEMAKRGWIEGRDNLTDQAEGLVTSLMRRARVPRSATALFHKNDQKRANAKTDAYALNAWCWRVLAQANERNLSATYEPAGSQDDMLKQVAKLSPAIDGPLRAVEFLAEQGIAVEVVPHLPRTHLDGAAMKAQDGRPVIGLTLRYDRIDNFWWVLMHELAHVALHLPETDETFIDDLKLDSTEDRESEADKLAHNCLIPAEAWRDSNILDNPTPIAVMALAQEIGVHPAIIAGRARHKLENYRLLSQFVGTGEVRCLFRHELGT